CRSHSERLLASTLLVVVERHSLKEFSDTRQATDGRRRSIPDRPHRGAASLRWSPCPRRNVHGCCFRGVIRRNPSDPPRKHHLRLFSERDRRGQGQTHDYRHKTSLAAYLAAPAY